MKGIERRAYVAGWAMNFAGLAFTALRVWPVGFALLAAAFTVNMLGLFGVWRRR